MVLPFIKKVHPFLAFTLLSILLFWKSFAFGMIPFPGDYLLAWYQPWKTYTSQNGILGIPHKPVADDVFRHQYPMKVLVSDEIKKGELPLWNPYNGAGQPLLGMMHPGFLNPLNIVFLFLPSLLAWSIIVVIQIPILATATFIFARKLGHSIYGAYFTSLALIFSGFVVVRLLYTEFLFVFTGLPLMLYVFEDLMQNSNSKSIFFVPIIIAFIFLSGQPQMILYVLLFIVGYVLFRFFSIKKNKTFKTKHLFLFFCFIGIGFLVSAIQLLPTIELFKSASINVYSSEFIFKNFLLPFSSLITILIPNYFGNQATYNFWGKSDFTETAAWIGLIPCFFAFIGLFFKKIKIIDARWFLIFVTIITAASSIDWIGSRALFSLPIPIISTGVPSRVFGITLFAISILSGYGIDLWRQEKHFKKKLFIPTTIFATSILAIILVTIFLYAAKSPCPSIQVSQCRSIALRNTILEISFFIICLGFSIFSLYTKNRKKILLLTGILSVVIFAGYYNFAKFMPFTQAMNVFSTNSLIQELKGGTLDARYFGFQDANLKADFATQFRIYDPQYFDPLYIKRYGELVTFSNLNYLPNVLSRSDVEIINTVTNDKEVNSRRNRLLELLSVKYLVYKRADLSKITLPVIWQDKNWFLLQNDLYLPRVYSVNNIEILKDPRQILKRLFEESFNPKTKVILEEQPKQIIDKNAVLKIISVQYSENKIEVKESSSATTLLVVTDNYYPGWKAYVDNKETKIFRANYTFRAIVLSPGNHTVVFAYKPASFFTGLEISIASIIALGVILFLKLKLS